MNTPEIEKMKNMYCYHKVYNTHRKTYKERGAFWKAHKRNANIVYESRFGKF